MEYHNQQFEDFYNGWEREDYQNTWPDVWNVTEEKLTRSGSTYFWWGALLLLPGLPFVFSERKMRVPLLGLLLVSAGFFASIWSFPHYAAPVTCVIFLLLVHAIRHLRMMRIGGRPVGAALSCAAVFLLAGEIGLRASNHSCDPLEWTCQGDPSRAAIQEQSAHKARLLDTIARRFEPWRQRYARLSRELRDQPYLLTPPRPPTRM